jgi:Fe(3+) dicitrate transport protein
VLTGTGVLRFGPQTIGGVINYLTPEPPQDFSGELDLSAGTLGYRRLRAQVGGAGHGVDVVLKEGEGARDHQALEQRDASYKGVFDLSETQQLTLRASVLNEDSDVTYSGLTDAEYRLLGPRYNPFVNDHFDVERYGSSATWSIALSDAATLATSAYYYEFHRDWGRQSSTTSDGQCGAAFTNARLAGTRVDVDTCNSRQNRNRDFTTAGIEPRLQATWSLGSIESALETGIRVHRERQDRLQFNGTTPTATTGTLAEHNERDVDALSAFVQNRFAFGDLALIPALRYESIDLERRNRLGAGSRGTGEIREWIPGLGATWDGLPDTTVYAGVHEGFAPPRVEDLIGASGGSVDVDAEHSRNLELGIRGRWSARWTYQIAAFDNDFDNQIAVGSIAAGSTPLAQGEARYRGLEVSARAQLPTWGEAMAPFVEFAYTALPTAEQRSPLRRVDNGQAVAGSAAGRRMPYAPRHTGSLRVGAVRGPFDASAEAVYVGQQFADFANTDDAPINGNGQVGALGGYTLLNLAMNYALPNSGWTVYATVKNALDRQYIADRTRGILPGVERQVLVGASYAF